MGDSCALGGFISRRVPMLNSLHLETLPMAAFNNLP